MNTIVGIPHAPHPVRYVLLWLIMTLLRLMIETGAPDSYILIREDGDRLDSAGTPTYVVRPGILDRTDYLARLGQQSVAVEPEPAIVMIDATVVPHAA